MTKEMGSENANTKMDLFIKVYIPSLLNFL
jgi:hypothetical protein